MRREQASGRRDQQPSARGPIRGTCVEACSKRQPRERLVRAAGFRHPSYFRLPGASAGGLSTGPPRSQKNAAMRAMGALRVLQPFPQHHCTIASPGKKWACLPRRTPQTRPFGLLRSLLRSLNGKKLRTGALLTRLDVPFNLVADGVP